MVAGGWALVPLVALVVGASWVVWVVGSAGLGPFPPAASTFSPSPLNERSVLTVGRTSNCEVVTMVSPLPPRDAAWSGLIGGDGVATTMGR